MAKTLEEYQADAKKLEEQVKTLQGDVSARDASLRGVSAERDQHKARANAWDKLGTEAGDQVTYDPTTSLPTAWNTTPAPTDVANPFGGVVDNPGQVDQWFDNRFQQSAQNAGYITAQQHQQGIQRAAQQGAQLAKAQFDTYQNVRETVAKHEGLKDVNSDLSKAVVKALADGAGPGNAWAAYAQGATGFTNWQELNYAAPNALPMAVNIALGQMSLQKPVADAENADAEAKAKAAEIAAKGGGDGSGALATPDAYKAVIGHEDQMANLIEESARNAGMTGI